MSLRRWALVVVVPAAVGVGVVGGLSGAAASGVPGVDVPSHRLTPGAIFPQTTARVVCVAGYSRRVRNVSVATKRRVFARYRVRYVPGRYEVDHLVSLELGGSNAVTNLWPEPYAGPWGARTKDKLENKLHALVCAGRLRLGVAQRLIATRWVATYRRDLGTPSGAGTSPPAPSPSTEPVNSGGFYASTYGSAHYIYCADDSAWRSLSPRYLVHFATWAQATAALPGRTLHQPC